MKKLTTEQIRDIKGHMAEFFAETKAQVVPEEEYQAGLKAGHPLICSRWHEDAREMNQQIWQNESLRNVIRRQCSVCKNDICMAEMNKEATFPICLECFMEYRKELEAEGDPEENEILFRKKDNDETVAG